MKTTIMQVERAEARALYRKYKEHQSYSAPIDQEIQRTYQLIAQGRVVIRAIDSIVKAGLNDQGLPKLAIAGATAERNRLTWSWEGIPRMTWASGGHHGNVKHTHRYFLDLPREAAPRPPGTPRSLESLVPIVPIHLRPKRGLENYHILYEAEWDRVVPVDPMLIRRIGAGDLWVVVAAWDLTEVERAALAARLTA